MPEPSSLLVPAATVELYLVCSPALPEESPSQALTHKRQHEKKTVITDQNHI